MEEPCRVDPMLSHSLVGPVGPFTVQGLGFSFRVVISAAVGSGNDPFRQVLNVSCAPPMHMFQTIFNIRGVICHTTRNGDGGV